MGSTWWVHPYSLVEYQADESSLQFFKTVSEHYDLIPEDNLTIPPEAEDIEALIAKQREAEDFRPRSNNGTRTLEDFQSWPRESGSDSDDSDGEGSEFDLDDKDIEDGEEISENIASSESLVNGEGELRDDTREPKDDSEEMEEIPVSMLDISGGNEPTPDSGVKATAESSAAPAVSVVEALDVVGDAASDEKGPQTDPKPSNVSATDSNEFGSKTESGVAEKKESDNKDDATKSEEATNV
jgi:hypothetical protein